MKRDCDILVDKITRILSDNGMSRQEIARVINYRKDLRDEMAMSAMNGIMAATSDRFFGQKYETMARTSYELADAMLEQRNR